MKRLDEVMHEVLGDLVFEHNGYWKSDLAAENFTFGIDAESGKPIVSFTCRYEHKSQARLMPPGYAADGEHIEHVSRVLDPENVQLDSAANPPHEESRASEAICKHIDYILEAYGFDRERLTEMASEGQTQLSPDEKNCELQKYIVSKYLSQQADRSELRSELEHVEGVPPSMRDAAVRESEYLLHSPAVSAPCPNAVYERAPQHGIPAKTLAEVFEHELAWNVFGDDSMRLKVTGISPTAGSDASGYQHPAVKFDAVVTENGTVKHYEDVVVLLTEDGYGDAYADVLGDKRGIPEEFGENIDQILQAYGFSLESIFRQTLFEPTVSVPGFILEALENYEANVEEPVWENEDDKEKWEETLKEIEACTGTQNFTIGYAFKSGFDSYYGDMYTVSCLSPAAIEKKRPDFVPDDELTIDQQHVLNAFFEQNMKTGRIASLILTESQDLPKLLVDSAYARFQDMLSLTQDRKPTLHR